MEPLSYIGCLMFYCGVFRTYTNVVLLLCVQEVLQDIILISSITHCHTGDDVMSLSNNIINTPDVHSHKITKYAILNDSNADYSAWHPGWRVHDIISNSYHSVTRAMCPMLYETRGRVAPEGREQYRTHCPRNRVITGLL